MKDREENPISFWTRFILCQETSPVSGTLAHYFDYQFLYNEPHPKHSIFNIVTLILLRGLKCEHGSVRTALLCSSLYSLQKQWLKVPEGCSPECLTGSWCLLLVGAHPDLGGIAASLCGSLTSSKAQWLVPGVNIPKNPWQKLNSNWWLSPWVILCVFCFCHRLTNSRSTDTTLTSWEWNMLVWLSLENTSYHTHPYHLPESPSHHQFLVLVCMYPFSFYSA